MQAFFSSPAHKDRAPEPDSSERLREELLWGTPTVPLRGNAALPAGWAVSHNCHDIVTLSRISILPCLYLKERIMLELI
jgi:hypothetical protein